MGTYIGIRAKWKGLSEKVKNHLHAMCWHSESFDFDEKVKMKIFGDNINLLKVKYNPGPEELKGTGCRLINKVVNTITNNEELKWNLIIVPMLPEEEIHIPEAAFPDPTKKLMFENAGGLIHFWEEPLEDGSKLISIFYDVTRNPPRSSHMKGKKYMTKSLDEKWFEVLRAQILFHELVHVDLRYYVVTHPNEFANMTKEEIDEWREKWCLIRTNIYRLTHSKKRPLRAKDAPIQWDEIGR